MATSSFLDSTFNTNFTFFIVASKTSVSTNEVNTSNQTVSWYSGGIGSFTAYTNNLVPNNSIQSPPGSALVTSPTVQTFRHNGTTATIRFNDLGKSVSTSGNLGLSGALTIGSLSNNTFYLHGDVAEIIVYNSALTNEQLDQIDSYLLMKYGIATYPLFIFDGDSITIGNGSTGGQTYPYQAQTQLGTVGTYQNIGVSGQTVVQMSSDAATQVDPVYSSTRTSNILSLLGGTNDLYFGANGLTTYNNIVAYSQARRLAGFKVIVNTILPRSNSGTPLTFETDRQTINTLIRSNWTTFADGISDIASDSRIGDAGDETNTTYFSPDKVHLTNTGYGVIANYVVAAIRQITSPISISGITTSEISTTNATITWITNQSASTRVLYGLTSSYDESTTESDTSSRVLNQYVRTYKSFIV